MNIGTTITRYKCDGVLYATIEELEQDGLKVEDAEEIEIDLDVEFDGEWVDEGIGGYEYWGMRGNDVRWCYEVEDIENAMDSSGKDWKDDLTSEELADIIERCGDYGADNSGSSYDDYDHDED